VLRLESQQEMPIRHEVACNSLQSLTVPGFLYELNHGPHDREHLNYGARLSRLQLRATRLYLAKFSAGELGWCFSGRHGTVRAEKLDESRHLSRISKYCCRTAGAHMLRTHATLRSLPASVGVPRLSRCAGWTWNRLYADADCVRLLKPLCNTEQTSGLTWLTKLTLMIAISHPCFTTTSSVILIANEWRTVNPNVRALEDRAIILHFDPPNTEIHRRVGECFRTKKSTSSSQQVIPSIRAVSMRHYCKASQLRRAGFADWRNSVLQMVLPDPRLAMCCITATRNSIVFGT